MKFETDSNQKAYNVSQIRLEHPNAYKAWTPEEDSQLLMEHRSGRTTKELARIFQRQNGAITSRLAKLLDLPIDDAGSNGQSVVAKKPMDRPPKNLREAILDVIKSRPPASLTLVDVARLLIGLGESKRIRRLELYKHPHFGMFPHLHRRENTATN